MLPYGSALLLAGAGAGVGGGGPFTSSGRFGMPGVFGGSPQGGSWGAFGGRVTLTQLNARLDADSNFSTYSLYMGGSVAGGKFKPVLYADSSGVPGALLATGSEITLTGAEANSTQTFNFGSTVTLTHGTKYWFGLFTDSSWFWPQSSSGGNVPDSRNKDGFTYASGVPSSVSGTSDTGGIVNIVANVSIARGVGGNWDSYNWIGADTISAANEIYLIKVTVPMGGASASAIGIRLSSVVTVGGHMKAVIYSDSSGSPNALIAVGSQVTVAAAYDELQSTFTGITLSAGDYWIGVITDSVQRFESVDGVTKRMSGITYSSPPSTFTVSGTSATNGAGFYLLFS